VQQKIVTTKFDLTSDQVQRIQNFLNERLANRSLAEVRALVQRELQQTDSDHPDYDAWVIGEKSLPEQGFRVHLQGTSHLAAHPEFADAQTLGELLQAFERKESLLELMDRFLDGSGVRVMLGSEHEIPQVQSLSCVGASLDQSMIGLMGPPRMDYERLVPLVGYATELFGRYWKMI
jgi:heat-inducible transcriptional repressor